MWRYNSVKRSLQIENLLDFSLTFGHHQGSYSRVLVLLARGTCVFPCMLLSQRLAQKINGGYLQQDQTSLQNSLLTSQQLIHQTLKLETTGMIGWLLVLLVRSFLPLVLGRLLDRELPLKIGHNLFGSKKEFLNIVSRCGSQTQTGFQPDLVLLHGVSRLISHVCVCFTS